MTAAVLLLLLYKDISPYVFSFVVFFFLFSFSIQLCFFPLSPLFSSLLSKKKSLCLFPLSLFSLPFLHPFLSKKKNPLSLSFGFSSPLLFCIRAIFIGARGAGSTHPRPIICMGCEATTPPCHGTGCDVQWGCRLQDTPPLLSHHKEVRVVFGFGFNRARGEGERGRKQGEKTKTYLALLHV